MLPSVEVAAAPNKVTAVVELKARFDEASNIRWARDMEAAGVQVFHGLVGLKNAACKLSLMVRRDPDGVTRSLRAYWCWKLQRDLPRRIYTDLSLFTANPEITRTVTRCFQFLTTAYACGESHVRSCFLVAPLDLAGKGYRIDRP